MFHLLLVSENDSRNILSQLSDESICSYEITKQNPNKWVATLDIHWRKPLVYYKKSYFIAGQNPEPSMQKD